MAGGEAGGEAAGMKTRTFQVYSCQHLWLPQPLSSEVCGKVHYGHRESWLEKLVVFSFFWCIVVFLSFNEYKYLNK